jgi:hypothetical protein
VALRQLARLVDLPLDCALAVSKPLVSRFPVSAQIIREH